jgi:glycosyltransferase involved in cell wall biosynthesis
MVAEGSDPTRLVASSRRSRRPRVGGPHMTEHMANGMPTTDIPLVLHVIPTARARGAQREARALADHLDRPGVRHHRVLCLFAGSGEVVADRSLEQPGGDSPAVGFDRRLVLRLRSALADMDPDVVVAHGSEPLKYLVPAMVGRRRPLAYYAIGTYSGSGRASQLRLWRALLGRADIIAAEGAEVRQECIDRLGVPPHRVVVTPNGRDPDVFRPNAESDDAPRSGPPRLLFVGAFTSGKRPDRFVEVVAALRARGLELRATAIGDGPLRAGLAVPAEKAGVELWGSRSDVADQMRQADLLVFPSAPEGEGMPGVLIEAGLSGLPVVATAVPGVRSIVQDDETGLVVPTDDLEALVDATTLLVEDAGMRGRLGRGARQRGLDHFSLEAVGRVWMNLLQPLLDGATGTRHPEH